MVFGVAGHYALIVMNLKMAVDVMKTRPCFDPSTGSGSARTGWRGHHPLGENPFALRAASGAAVERGREAQLPFLG